MAVREICGNVGISKTRRSSKTGFLFFLLLQMSLLSKVWSQDVSTTESTSTNSESPTSVSPGSSTSVQADTSQGSSTSVQADTSPGSSTSVQADTSPGSSTSVQADTSPGSSTSVHHSSSSVSTQIMATTQSSVTQTSPSSSIVSSMAYTVSGNGSLSTGIYSMISCPAFTCSSDCYGQFLNSTMKPCPVNASFCEVTKQDTGYSVSCSGACGMSCGNTSLSNCTMNCCNTSSCLNNTLSTLSSLLTTAATTISTTSTTTVKATTLTTTQNNGKVCQNVVCTGAQCYKSGGYQMLCPIGQDYCMLKKTLPGTVENWQGGCSGDCRMMPACTSTSTTTCYLECCNATTAKVCLKLTGDLNMPSSASRGLHSSLLLLASVVLLWMLRVST